MNQMLDDVQSDAAKHSSKATVAKRRQYHIVNSLTTAKFSLSIAFLFSRSFLIYHDVFYALGQINH